MRILYLPEIFTFIEDEKISIEINDLVFALMRVDMFNFENIIETDYAIKEFMFSGNFFNLKEDVYQITNLKSSIILRSFFNRKLILKGSIYTIPLREFIKSSSDCFFAKIEPSEDYANKIHVLNSFVPLNDVSEITFVAKKTFVMKDLSHITNIKIFSSK